jgi:hypothetical protein
VLSRYSSEKGWRAVDAAARGHEDQAQCLWRELLGDIFSELQGGSR